MNKAIIIENEKELKNPLSEVCDFHGVEYAAYLLGKFGNEPVIKFQENLEPDFEIAGMTIPEAYQEFGGETVLKYIYDWARHESENLDEKCDNDTSKLDYDDDARYCECNLFADNLEGEGKYEVED